MPIEIVNRKSADTSMPKSCPFCASTDVHANGKITAASYWRCGACGQVWNPERLGGGGRHLDYGRSR